MRLTRFTKGLAALTIVMSGSGFASFGQRIDQANKQPVSVKSYIPDDQKISPMPLQERIKRGVVPARGVVSIAPGKGKNDQMKTGNGKMHININGNPLADEIPFRHEHIQLPWPIGMEAPKMASVLPEVRRLILEGKYVEGLDLASQTAIANGSPEGQGEHDWLNAFIMNIDIPMDGPIKNYLRTCDFESGEVKVLWEDNRGRWERNAFVSRPDNVVVQLLAAPINQLLNTRIRITTGRGQMAALPRQAGPVAPVAPGVANGIMSGANPSKNSPTQTFERDFNGERLIITDRFSGPNFANKGYAAVIRIALNGGKATIDDGELVITGAKSATLITRIEWYDDFQQSRVDNLVNSLNQIAPDYKALLARNREVVSEVINRTNLSFNTSKEEKAMSGEELLADQKIRIGYNLALLEKLFDMGRYYLLNESGDYPPIKGHLNVNINLQVCGAPMANLPETMNSFSKWIDFMLPDAKVNAKNIFGARGALYATHPDRESGALFHWDYGWPHHYWISAGGWSYSPIWDRYLVTGDKEYLRDRVMPGLRELGLFYEDFLSLKDKDGNYIFVPSYSPENWPANTSNFSLPNNRANPTAMINTSMDISVCREVLTHLIEGAETLGTDTDKIPVWKDLLAKMPPYLIDTDGALKEWSWPTLEEFQDHRHISHMYGVWPADVIDPDRTPELARATWLADVKRAQGMGSGFGISHRMLAAARLKNNNLVNTELKQLIEQGYIGPVLSSSHDPYSGFFADQQGSILAILMEMLVYSREGVIELLPALPEPLDHGSIRGILARTFAQVDNLTWDMKARTADLTLTSARNQDVTLIVRHGIESIVAPDGVLKSQPEPDATTCVLHLTKDKPAKILVRLGMHKPSDWILNLDKKN